MLRLTLMLSCAIYAGLVVYGTPQGPVEDASVAEVAQAPSTPAPLLSASAATDRLTTEDGRVLQFAAMIVPASVISSAGDVARVSTFEPEVVTSSASAASPDLPMVVVTGSQVNLRAGPSTNDAVIGGLTRGQEAELVASLGNGWAQIRVVSSGTTGFMADRFLAPVN